MKKSLLVLPLAALLLAGCNLIPSSGGGSKKKSSGNPSGNVSNSGQTGQDPTGADPTGADPTSTSGGGGGPVTEPTPPSGAVDFDLTEGTHTAVLDFEGEPDRYSYPRAEESDTSANQGEIGGCNFNLFHSYKGSYEGAYWLMMKNKDNWDATGQAWFGNAQSLGSITSLEVVVREGASTKLSYDLSVGNSEFSTAQTGGTEFKAGVVGRYTGSGKGYFAVSTKPISGSNKYNGQIAKITVTYTI